MADIKHKLKKYKQYFEANPDGDKVLSVLRKLDALPVSIALLQDTGIGKVVNSFRKKPDEIGALAKSIVAKWKTLVTQEAKKTTQEVELKEEQYVPDSSRKPQKYEVTYKPTPIGEESPSGNEYSPQHVEQSYSPGPLSRQESIEPRYSPSNQSEENSDDDEYRPRSLSPKYSKKVGYSPTKIRDCSSEGEDEEYDPENVAVSNDQVYSPKSVSDDDAYDVATPEASASDQSASEDEEYNPSCITKESSKYQASYTPTPISESDKPHKSSKDSKYNKKDSSSSGKYQSNSSDRTKHSSHSDKHSSHSDKHSSHSDKHSSNRDKHSSNRDKHSSHSDRHSSENDKHSTRNDKYSNKQSSNRDRHDSSKVKQSSKIDKQDSEKYRNGSSSSNQKISTSSSKKAFDKKTSNSDKKTSGSDKHSSPNDKESRHSDRKSSSYDKDKASVEGHKKSISVNTLPSSSDKRPSSGDKHSSTSNNKPSSSSKHSSSSDKKSNTSDNRPSSSNKHSSDNRPSSSNKHSSDNRPSSSNKHSSDNRTSSSSKHSSDKSPRSSDKHSSSSDKKSSSDKLPSKEKATKQSNHQYTEIKKSKSDKLKSEKRKIQPMVDTSDLFSPDETAVIKKVKAVHREPEENMKSTKNISHDEKRDSKSKSSSSSTVKSHSKAKPDKTNSHSKSSSSSKGEKRKKDEDETEPANDITEGFSFDDFLNCDVKAVKKKPRKDVTLDLKPTGTKWSSSLVSSKPSTSRRPKNDDLHSTSFSMPSPAKQKIDIHESDILDLLPETNAHYRPLSKIPERKLDMATFDPMVIGTKTGKRTMVYSGKKHGLTEMKPLFGLCMQVLIDNIDALDYVGCIPYEILKPVLERCTVPQLLRLEDLNPHFVGDTEELWAIHCERDFKREQPDEMEAWREMYLRLQEEREVKLERLRLNMNKQAAAKPKGRQVQLAYVDNYVKPPRDVLRKQQRYGTAKVVAPSNSLHGASSSGKPRSSYNPHVAVPQPRMVKSVAPMMQKINKLIAKRRR
ncbi:hypothetical protein SNE40_021652 [Patella caerulea]|uniref:TFIIS N-terminal domain-containing protein n=1 Tax=Patella caerulea TaxID=87958 RepID=A0AAN8FZY7_PATCE